MRLIAFSVEGYRRFVTKTSVKLHGDMVAFVGPNEAGKSSLLRALAHLHKDGGFEPNECPRRTSHQPRLAWHFQLEEADKVALSGSHDTADVERAVVTKQATDHGRGILSRADRDATGQHDRKPSSAWSPSATSLNSQRPT